MMDIDASSGTHIDPVCRMELDQRDATGTSEYEGKTYYFCSTACKEKFDENPDEYTEELADQ